MTVGPAAALLRRLSLHTELNAEETAAVGALVTRTQAVAAGETIARSGEPLDVATIVLEGVVARTKMLPDARRQILSMRLPGDLCDAHSSVLAVRDDSLEALSRARVAVAPQARLAELGRKHPRLHEAFLRETLIEASIAREWVLNVGQRAANAAVAHLLCELRLRASAGGLAVETSLPFALKQQDLADALGLSLIHLNRVLSQLRSAGLISTGTKRLVVLDWAGLTKLARFDPSYLHTPVPTELQAAGLTAAR